MGLFMERTAVAQPAASVVASQERRVDGGVIIKACLTGWLVRSKENFFVPLGIRVHCSALPWL
jgi:hypothetical protein